MNNHQFEQFAETMKRALEVYGSNLSSGAIETWWRLLTPYPIEDVQQALQAHLAESVYPPKPADVIQRLQTNDGRPGAEEAWGIALGATDESETVVWTDEIAAAKSACDEILAAGDEVGARMAFKERYEAEVRNARAQQRPVRWFVSLGHDPDRRTEAIRQAYKAGRLPREKAERFLPPADAAETPAGYIGQDSPAVPDETAREQLRHLRETLAQATETEQEPDIDPDVAQRTQAWAAARQNDENEQAETAEGEG